jgi:endonuclease/exonuclease/phosphatase family metal-dependent hydrolase
MLKVMSSNLRYGTAKDGENSWENRKEIMVEMFRSYHPDLIGTQEGLKFQLEYITSAVPEYEFFGVSRQGTDEDEFAAIIYDSERLSLLDGGNFWLSETPDLPASRSWDSSLPRMATWALFETKDGKRLYHYNTHLDHHSEEARRRGVQVIWDHMKSRDDETPLILTGDFNATPESLTWRFLTGQAELDGDKGNLLDAWDSARRREGSGRITYHGFKGKAAEDAFDIADRRMIDWILFRGELVVEYIEIVSFNRDGRYPSDHYPVYAELRWP